MEEGGIDVQLNDVSSDIVKDQTQKPWTLKTKIIIFSIILSIIISLIILAIIISILTKSDINIQPFIGQIRCVYYIDSISNNINILGKEFTKNSDFDIFIDDKKVDFLKENKFSSIGNHNINFNLYDDIAMDYMFKDVF